MKRKTIFKSIAVIGCALAFTVLGSACDGSDLTHFFDRLKGHQHSLVFMAAKEPTCTERGNIDHWYCSAYNCYKRFSDENGKNEIEGVYIPRIPHVMEFHEGTEATCTSRGIKDYYYCTACEFMYDNEQGSNKLSSDDLIIYKKAHTLTHIAAHDATCTEDGAKEHYYCEVCEGTFTDEKGLHETTDTVIPASHQIADYWLYDDFQHWHKYSCGHSELEEKLDHTPEGGVCTVCECRVYSVGLDYELNADRESAKLTGKGECTDTEIYIAATYEGVPVTEIAENVFQSDEDVTYVHIPSTVKTIGNSAFSDCTALKEVSLNASLNSTLESIGAYAFYNTSVEKILLPDSVTFVGEGAFANCTKLEKFSAGGRNSSFGARALEGCTALKKVVIIGLGEGGVIGEYAFSGCTKLDELSLYHVTEIKAFAFHGCTALKSVKFSTELTVIGEQAFGACVSLESISFYDNSKLESIDEGAFMGCTALTRVDIPSSVKWIGANAFDSAILHVYTETRTKPRGWDENWASKGVTVHWGDYGKNS